MKVLDLFSGIGGFSLGLERAGMTTVAFCEIEPYAQAVLRKHWPGVPIYEDVRTLTAERLRADGIDTVDLVCGGFPCQPWSDAGEQQGKDDHRHLWPEMLRIVQEIRPAWVIGENVAGFIRMALDDCCADLEAAGYEVQPVVIPACAVDAEHRRDRVWIIAHADRKQYKSRTHEIGKQITKEFSSDASGLSWGYGVNDDVKELRDGAEGGKTGSAIRPHQCWPPEPEMGRVAYGVSGGVDRLKGLGNAVVPQIPEIIGKAIMEVEKR